MIPAAALDELARVFMTAALDALIREMEAPDPVDTELERLVRDEAAIEPAE